MMKRLFWALASALFLVACDPFGNIPDPLESLPDHPADYPTDPKAPVFSNGYELLSGMDEYLMKDDRKIHGRSYRFEYDEANRLRTVKIQAAPSLDAPLADFMDLSFCYDENAVGYVMHVPQLTSNYWKGVFSFEKDKTRAVQLQEVTYDSKKRVLSSQFFNFYYDKENQLERRTASMLSDQIDLVWKDGNVSEVSWLVDEYSGNKSTETYEMSEIENRLYPDITWCMPMGGQGFCSASGDQFGYAGGAIGLAGRRNGKLMRGMRFYSKLGMQVQDRLFEFDYRMEGDRVRMVFVRQTTQDGNLLDKTVQDFIVELHYVDE